mmetsp:Transcript_57632/g.137036  ORF Transcript_57632/g.137036 Transcript_57632/m.137036 type:complete len:253 (-) Transcript_57632:100-858(-)
MGATPSNACDCSSDCASKDRRIEVQHQPHDHRQHYEYAGSPGFDERQWNATRSSSSSVPPLVAAASPRSGLRWDMQQQSVLSSSIPGRQLHKVDPQHVQEAQQVVRAFVQIMVNKGQVIPVRTSNGSHMECHVQLDRQLSKLTMQRVAQRRGAALGMLRKSAREGHEVSPPQLTGKKREILLRRVSEIVVGLDARDAVAIPLDEHCLTLLLMDGQAVTFHFQELVDRDTFALCLSMFIDGQRSEVDEGTRTV